MNRGSRNNRQRKINVEIQKDRDRIGARFSRTYCTVCIQITAKRKLKLFYYR